jgi:F-type H+-transporting ATPase subunit delta
LTAGSVAKRYARALAEVAAASGELEPVRQDLRSFNALLRDNRDLRQFLANPSVLKTDRVEVVGQIVGRMGLRPLSGTFLRILAEAGRLTGLATILHTFEGLLDERLGRVKAVVTTAVPLDAAARARLTARLTAVTGRQAYLEIRQDPTILGGLITQIGSQVFDGSLRARLARLRDELVRA